MIQEDKPTWMHGVIRVSPSLPAFGSPSTPRPRLSLKSPPQSIQVEHEGRGVLPVRFDAAPLGEDRPAPDPDLARADGDRPVLVDPARALSTGVHPVHPQGAEVEPVDRRV